MWVGSHRMQRLALVLRHLSSVGTRLGAQSTSTRKTTTTTAKNTQRFLSSTSSINNMATASDKPIVLYSVPTPNGATVSILLEELKQAYGGPDYDAVRMSISDADIGKVHNQVKSPWFLEINPNGRIPTITHNGFSVFETSAILLYLTQVFDKEHKFAPEVTDVKEHSEVLQWLFFSHGGVGPMQGQLNHFNLFAKEKIPYAIDRYLKETVRLYGVLESRLAERDYLAGPGRGTYGIADIKTFGWVRRGPAAGVALEQFPKLKAWHDKIETRPAVQSGLKIPPSA